MRIRLFVEQESLFIADTIDYIIGREDDYTFIGGIVNTAATPTQPAHSLAVNMCGRNGNPADGVIVCNSWYSVCKQLTDDVWRDPQWKVNRIFAVYVKTSRLAEGRIGSYETLTDFARRNETQPQEHVAEFEMRITAAFTRVDTVGEYLVESQEILELLSWFTSRGRCVSAELSAADTLKLKIDDGQMPEVSELTLKINSVEHFRWQRVARSEDVCAALAAHKAEVDILCSYDPADRALQVKWFVRAFQASCAVLADGRPGSSKKIKVQESGFIDLAV